MVTETGPYDLAIIGGGINGCGIARDAAGRGAKVLLLEAGDLASGTSSASTKLIHGGLRYLEHYEFGLVREALGERERLWCIAPHIIRPLRFVLPWVPGLRPRWLLRLGLFLYDHLGARRLLPRTTSIRLAGHPAQAPLKPHFTHAFQFSDCAVDDARLVVLNARDAADRGADIHTRCPATAITRRGSQWEIETPKGIFRARALVNAAGPSAAVVLQRAGMASSRSVRLVRGSHIVVRKLFEHDDAYFFQLPDGRIFFAIGYEDEFTLIGTTDCDHDGAVGEVAASEEEIVYLCGAASLFFERPVTPADVVWSFAGLRPLVDDGSGKPEAATRGYTFEASAETEGAMLLTVFGGKITTYRRLAEDALDHLAQRIPAARNRRWTGTEPLPGGAFGVDEMPVLLNRFSAHFPFIEARTAQRLLRAYGTRAFDIFQGCGTLADCGLDFGFGLTELEIRYLVDYEWARTADDILWRRSKLGLHFTDCDRENLAKFLGRK